MNATVPDGLDPELAVALAYFDNVADLRAEMRFYEAWGHAATIVRAVLARPAAGRDLTAQDLSDAITGREHHETRQAYMQRLADRLNGIARPAVARTDAPCQGTCTGCGAGEDQVCAGNCRCVASGVHDRDGYTPDMPEYTAPADDTAAPDPRPQLRSVVAELSGLLDRAMNHGIGVEYIAQRRETYMSDLRRAEVAVADDSAAGDRITAVKLLLDATTDPMDRTEAETHLDILGVTRAEVDEAKRRSAGQPVRDSQPCRDCPPPGDREVDCGFCGTTVPALAECENGLPWPTDDEQSRLPVPGQDGARDA